MGLYNYKVQRKLTKKGQAKQEEKAIRQHQTSSADDILASGAIEYSPVDPIMMATGVGAAVRGGQALLPAVADELTMGGRGLFNLGKGLLKKGVEKSIRTFSKKPIISGKEMMKDPLIMKSMQNYHETMKLQNTKHKGAIDLFDELKTRAKTSEGKKRLNSMGIEEDDFFDKLSVLEDNKVEASFSPFSLRGPTVNLNKSLPSGTVRPVMRHEVEHYIQKGNISEIDEMLKGLDLRKSVKKTEFNVSERNLDIDASGIVDKLSKKQAATDYFAGGSGGREKAPFLSELQQFMIDNKYIDNVHENITPDKIKEVFIDYLGKETYPLRVFDIMKPTDKNYKLLSKGLNKMFQAGAPIGLAGGLYNTNTK